MTDPIRRTSLLDRTAFSQGSSLSPLQTQVDGLVTRAVDEAANPRTLAAMVVGGAAYRFGRMGVMAFGANVTGTATMGVRGLSLLGGLGTEVTAFEFTNRSLATLSGNTAPNLWRWNGQGGWAQGLASSAITFGMLKSAGFAAREQNIIFQHALQSTAMVAGHNTAGALGFMPRPEGSLAEQFLHAEATNIQLGAGMSLLHSAAPGLTAMERSWDLSLQSREALSRPRPAGSEVFSSPFAMAMAGGRGKLPSGGLRMEGERNPLEGPQVVLSEMQGNGGSGSTALTKPTDWPPNIPDVWSTRPGSRLVTSREVTNTQELTKAIVEDGILKMLGEDAVDDVFGYGSFPFFRDGRPEDIRSWDADKKPDFIIVGDARRMAENLANHWRLSPKERKKLFSYVQYSPQGLREGFVFFNPDILIPGRGPVGFKMSLIDREAFFARREGRAVLEYVQVRLKDAHTTNLLWSRDRERALGHLEAIKDQMLDWSYLRLGDRPRFTTEDLFREFFRLSYRLEIYRFWENGTDTWKPSWDKGSKLFKERRDEIQPVLVEGLRRFAEAHRNTMAVSLNGRRVEPSEISTQNLYRLQFEDNAVETRQKRYKDTRRYFAHLNLRGITSYFRAALPSNKLSRAYYKQTPEEYAGRKARNLVYREGMGMKQVPFIAKFLAFPLIRYIPLLKKVALDSTHFPVYYSNLAPNINDLYAGRAGKGERFPEELRLNEAEYAALMNWIVANPDLASLKNVPLVAQLRDLTLSEDPAAQSGAAKLIRWMQRKPLLEPSVDQFIRSLNLPPPPPALPPGPGFHEDSPWEIKQMVEFYLPALNLLSVGETPRMYDLLRQTIRMSLPADSPRVAELIDYIDRSERGEFTLLRHQMGIHGRMADPAFINEAIPEPRPIPLQPPPPPVVREIHPQQRTHDALADTLSASLADPEKKKE